MVEQWSAQVFGAAVGLSILVAFVASRVAPGQRASLPQTWVAGAALVGLLGWEAAIQVPGNVYGLYLLTARHHRSERHRGQPDHGCLHGALRAGGCRCGGRHPAAPCLGSRARHRARAVDCGHHPSRRWSISSGSSGPTSSARTATCRSLLSIIATRAVPALAAAVLLAWPMLPRRSSPEAATGAWTAAPTPKPAARRWPRSPPPRRRRRSRRSHRPRRRPR